MTKDDLKNLGLTEKDVLDRLADKLCERYVSDEVEYKNQFERRIEDAVKKQVDKVLDSAMKKHILPAVTKMTEGICLEETNRWGEKRGTKLTFTEYLVKRVDSYIREEVDYSGKPKGTDSYSWKANGTRIAYMIHEHLQYHISRAMETALGDVNSSVRKGLEEAVKISLNNIRVTVDTKVTT